MDRPERQKKRQVIRPEEILIFFIVSAVFANSLYNLVYKKHNTDWGIRGPASMGQALLNIDTDCDVDAVKITSASRLRLSGPLCGTGEIRSPAANGFIRTEISNETNRALATVFTDLSKRNYSTDYIPLNSGENIISIRFLFTSGKTKSQTLRVVKE